MNPKHSVFVMTLSGNIYWIGVASFSGRIEYMKIKMREPGITVQVVLNFHQSKLNLIIVNFAGDRIRLPYYALYNKERHWEKIFRVQIVRFVYRF